MGFENNVNPALAKPLMHPNKAHAPLVIIHVGVLRPAFVCGGNRVSHKMW